jgi:uncharacterized protein YndB with AHSA1/START domain
MAVKTKNALSISFPSDTEILMTRDFPAPRDLVFQAFTDPKQIPMWWGMRKQKTVVDKMEVRPGGAWRYVCTEPDGSQYAFRGEYREVVPTSKLVYTFEFEPFPGHISLETVTFEEKDGITRMTNRTRFDSKADRDGMVESGMEGGANETMDRLEELLLGKA